MDLKKYLSDLTPAQRGAFAARCKTTAGQLRNVAYGDRTASTELAVLIERESRKAVTRIDLFPLTYMDKWPELARRRKHAQVTSAKEAANG